jgi:hypothetical protein
MGVTRLTSRRTLAISIMVALVTGFFASQYAPRWSNEPGPRLRRECTSLVDTVLNENNTVRRAELEEDLIKRGVNVPPPPSFPSEKASVGPSAGLSEGATEAKKDLDYWFSEEGEAARKAYEAKWDEIKNTPAYDLAWEAVTAKKRSKAIKDCVLSRARKEGVSIE